MDLWNFNGLMHEQYVKSENINDKLFIDKSIPRIRLHATNGNHSLKKKILLKILL